MTNNTLLIIYLIGLGINVPFVIVLWHFFNSYPSGVDDIFLIGHMIGIASWPLLDAVYLCYFIYLGIKKALRKIKIKSPKVFKALGKRLYEILGDTNEKSQEPK